MPSPTEMTFPISLTSTPPRYPSICSRMIFVISSALISMSSFLEAARYRVCASRFLGLFSGQPVSECLQLLTDGSVVYRASNLRDHSANQRRIDGDFHTNL